MTDIQKIKLGNTSPDSLMFGNVKVDTKGDSIFNGVGGNYFHYDYAGATFNVQGLVLFPYYRGSGSFAPNIYMWPWDMINMNQYDAYKDVNPGYGYLGYIHSGVRKNITNGLHDNITNPGAPNWGWSTNSNWGIAITLWSKEPNKTIDGIDYTDFGEYPIVIKLLDGRFDGLNWTDYNNDDVIVSQDKRTITIKRVPFSTHTALRIYDESDTSLSRVNTLLKDVIVDLTEMSFHNSQFYVGYPDSAEGYDVYLGDKHIWKKGRTLENCWKKYGIAVSTDHPNGFFMSNATCSDSSLIHPLKSAIKSDLHLNSTVYSTEDNYIFISVPNITTKVDNAVAGTKLTMKLVIDKGTPSRQSSWLDNSVILADNNGQLSFQSESPLQINKVSGDDTIEWHYELSIEFPQGTTLTDYAVVELVSVGQLYTINTQHWPNFSSLGLKLIEDYTGNVKINAQVYNNDFWDDIKQWYGENTYNDSCFKSGSLFAESNVSGEITLNMPAGNQFMYGANNFMHTDLEKITIVKPNKNTTFSSPYRMFNAAQFLKQINIVWPDDDTGKRFLCGANNVQSMFAGCKSLQTYPAQLIKWDENRSSSWTQTINCTSCSYAFEYSNLVTIPEYSNIDDENTILCSNFTEQMFNDCKALVTIGPILDMCIVQPENASKMFYNCNSLTSVKIKNLNHGDWDFANYGANAIGNFENLDLNSVTYLIDNLADLNNHIEGYDYNANQNISFQSWTSDYMNASSVTPNWDYTLISATEFACRRRYSNVSDTVCIAKTTFRTDIALPTFTIKNLKSTDTLYLIYNNGESTDTIVGGSSSIAVTLPQNTTGVEFRLVGNQSDRDVVSIILDGGLDWRIPRVGNATLYLPNSCRNTLIAGGVYDSTKWINKGWTIKDESGNTWSNSGN